MKVYLSGGIYKNNKEATENWREVVTLKLGKDQIINPCRNRAIYDPIAFTVTELITRDRQDINNADLILIYGYQVGNHLGIGTWCEMEYAQSLSKPIVIISIDPRIINHPWVKHHCVKIFDKLDEAINYIKDFWA